MSSQALMFLLTVALGGVCGFIFDLFRIFRLTIRHKNIYTYLEDILYWLIVVSLVFYFLLHITDGEIRFFFIIGVFLGMVIYFCTISIFVIRCSKIVINFFRKVFRLIYRLLLRIITPPILLVKFLLVTLQDFTLAILEKIMQPINNLLQKSISYGKIKTQKPIKKLKRKIKLFKRKIKRASR